MLKSPLTPVLRYLHTKKNAQKNRENVVVDKKKSACVIYEWPP